MPEISGIDHVALTVTDLATSLAFYQRLLGIESDGEMSDGSFVRNTLPLPDGSHLGLTQHDIPGSRGFDATTPGLDHLGLRCESRGALVEWVEHLENLGVEHSGVVDAHYGSALSFRDPDGNALEFFAPA